MHSLTSGDIAPRFSCPDQDGNTIDLYSDSVSGRVLGLLFCKSNIAEAGSALAELANHHRTIRDFGAEILVISRDPVALNSEQRERHALPFPILSDVDGNAFGAYGVPCTGDPKASALTAFLVRPNQHVLEAVSCDDNWDRLLNLLGQQRQSQNSGFHPPVLVLPDVLSRSDCERLIKIYQESDAPFVPLSSLKQLDRDAKTKVPDYGRRDRTDHMVGNPETLEFVSGILQRRLLPEIKKVFQYEIKSFEALRIACYRGERKGSAHGHRDNSAPQVAHRRFAMTINLNADDFEGGELHFLEFSLRKYKPETGAALVFSCSLLHEALQVRSGERYALLTFLF